MYDLNPEDNVELGELLEQLNYALSLEFMERWRHKYSYNIISIFQARILQALKDEKPVKISSLVSLYTKKHKYSEEMIRDFLECVDITLYYPLIYYDRNSRS